MTGDAPKLQPPSWWKYVGGREADERWALSYVAAQKQNLQLPARDKVFYLQAVERLATDAHPRAPHRPPDRINLWLVCHYLLGTMRKSAKAAAIDTAQLASDAGHAPGHDFKAIQRHAKRLETTALEFLEAVVGDGVLRFGYRPPPHELHRRLTLWIEGEVRKVR